MKQLTKESSQEELRAYFALVLDYTKTQDEFPVDLDDVCGRWRTLRKVTLFVI